MNARIFLIGFGVLASSASSVACDKLRAPDGDGKATVTAPSAEPAAAAPTAAAPATAAAPPTVAVQAGAKPAASSTTTVVNGNRAIRVQNGPNGLSTDFAGPHGSGAVQVAPGGVKVQGPNGTVIVPAGAVPGMPSVQ